VTTTPLTCAASRMQPVLYTLDPAAAAPYTFVPAASRGDSKKKPLIVSAPRCSTPSRAGRR
jgi:hypothetical protein